MKPKWEKEMEEWSLWLAQAASAIEQGQNLTAFVLHCHKDNRQIARRAYLTIRKRQGFVYGKTSAPKGTP